MLAYRTPQPIDDAVGESWNRSNRERPLWSPRPEKGRTGIYACRGITDRPIYHLFRFPRRFPLHPTKSAPISRNRRTDRL